MTTRRMTSLVQRYPSFQNWLDYVKSTYVAINAPFPTGMWNVFKRNINTRRNNHLEGKEINYLTLVSNFM